MSPETISIVRVSSQKAVQARLRLWIDQKGSHDFQVADSFLLPLFIAPVSSQGTLQLFRRSLTAETVSAEP
jgi:hypothetical protein